MQRIDQDPGIRCARTHHQVDGLLQGLDRRDLAELEARFDVIARAHFAQLGERLEVAFQLRDQR